MLSPANGPQDFRDRVTPFLQAHGFEGELAIEQVAGGGNNRVYRVQTEARAGLLKAYFQNPADLRNRFGAERAFYEYLWKHGVRRTPEPLGWDSERRLGLFTFVAGRKLRPDEITADSVAQALAFIAELNCARATSEGQQLSGASEACFSVSEHLACVERRVARLAQIESKSPLDRQAAALVTDELKPAWQRIRTTIGGQIQVDESLPEDQRCLSPSDFGFHNALMADDGHLRFFDFEYAGWDDPAKLVCDFFCQPQVPVALGYRDRFLAQLSQVLGQNASFGARVRLLEAAYRVKWCCIMLNDFVVSDRARRDFAQGAADADERRRIQLEKARHSVRHGLRGL